MRKKCATPTVHAVLPARSGQDRQACRLRAAVSPWACSVHPVPRISHTAYPLKHEQRHLHGRGSTGSRLSVGKGVRLAVRTIPLVVLSKTRATCSSGSGKNWWLSITAGTFMEKTRWWRKVSSWLPDWRRSTESSSSWVCGARCFTEKRLSQCAGVDFNAPQGAWKILHPVTNLTVLSF